MIHKTRMREILSNADIYPEADGKPSFYIEEASFIVDELHHIQDRFDVVDILEDAFGEGEYRELSYQIWEEWQEDWG
jgi:hypothetical protein